MSIIYTFPRKPGAPALKIVGRQSATGLPKAGLARGQSSAGQILSSGATAAASTYNAITGTASSLFKNLPKRWRLLLAGQSVKISQAPEPRCKRGLDKLLSSIE